MKRFKFEQSSEEFISRSGLPLIGQAIKRLTTLESEVNRQVPLRHGISHGDVVKSYLALLSTGKNDFEAIKQIESEEFFQVAMGLSQIPSEATLRQRMDQHARQFAELIKKASADFLINADLDLAPLKSDHIPLDGDLTPLDNSNTKKEGVSRTYKGFDGYGLNAMYLGTEGYALDLELREGKQHCQKDFPEALSRSMKLARRITQKPLLLRLDGGNDALENIDLVLEANDKVKPAQRVDFIIKWNPRGIDRDEWLEKAEKHGNWQVNRPGKRTAVFSVEVKRLWRGHEYTLSRVMRVIERTIDKHGQTQLVPDIEIEGWWTNVNVSDEQIIQLYCDHGTCEQYHSEIKSDLDVERLPSGKFETNALIIACTQLVYNILRWIGQNSLEAMNEKRRRKVKRPRIKTILQDLMYVASKFVKTARYVKLIFGRSCLMQSVLDTIYWKLSYA